MKAMPVILKTQYQPLWLPEKIDGDAGGAAVPGDVVERLLRNAIEGLLGGQGRR
jgi:hypothetical protein